MLDKHPRLNATLAHFFFLSEYRDRVEEILEKYPNVKFDLTPGWEMYIAFSKDTEGWHDFFEKYSERILFGTDSGNHKDNNAELNRLVYSAITRDSSEFPMPLFPIRSYADFTFRKEQSIISAIIIMSDIWAVKHPCPSIWQGFASAKGKCFRI